MKRLLFPYAPDPSESLIGAFAGALHDHRIRSIRTGIEGAGFGLARPGSLQMASGDQVAAIANLMRCDLAPLGATAFRTTASRDRIALGDLELPRAIFELERRRIGPRELKGRNIHRADWLNLLLPYCPRSLEQLVDSCPTCGPLGWRVTRGIANCDDCGEAVPQSAADDLASNLTGSYRLAANLMSRDGVLGAEAVSTLPHAIQAFARSSLCDVMVRVGVAFSRRRSGNALVDVIAQAPAEIAAVIASGARLIAGWPGSIKDEVRIRTDAMEGDLVAYDRLRVDLRWTGSGSQESRRLVEMAFPTLDGRTADPFADDRRYYSATQTNTKLWTDSGQLERLRKHGVIGFDGLPSQRRLRARYYADDVDALRIALDEAISLGSAASELDVPICALGQLVETGRLEMSGIPGVRTLRGVQISKSSVRKLIAQLMSITSNGESPAACIPLRRALAHYPGEKPWGECVEMLIRNKVTLYASRGGFSLRNLSVHPDGLPTLRCADGAFELDPTGIQRIPLRDAYEALGAPEAEAIVAIRSARLEILIDGRGKSICRRDLHRLIAEIAFTREMVSPDGASAIAMFHRLKRLRVPRVHGAWSRPVLLSHGMVKPLAMPSTRQPGSTRSPSTVINRR